MMLEVYSHLCLLRFLALIVVGIVVSNRARASDTDWHKVTTPHYELFTDLDSEAALDAGRELEKTREAFLAWPIHVQAGIDFARASWYGAESNDLGSAKNLLPIDEVATGYFAHVDVGFVFYARAFQLGPVLRYHHAQVESEHTNGSLSGFTALLAFYH